MYRMIYSLVFYVLLPFILLRLLWRSFGDKDYRKRWYERLACFKMPHAERGSIGLHAVSMGEAVAASPLIEGLLKAYPDKNIVVTCTTPTGSRRIQATFGDRVFHVYAPYDVPGIIRRFLKKTRLELLIIMERELWPNWLFACGAQNIPVILANARISERSSKRYQRLDRMFHECFQAFREVSAQTPEDARRFERLGIAKPRIHVLGNLKFDQALPENLADKARTLRESLGAERPVWIAASTHEGEESLVLSAFTEIRVAIPNALLILVPRHPERFDAVAQLCVSENYTIHRRSAGIKVPKAIDIFLGDTMGELPIFYAAADAAFVGGSLVSVGGHNPLEPALIGCPILMGPHVINCEQSVEVLRGAGALQMIEGEEGLAQGMIALLSDKTHAQALGQAGLDAVKAHEGAVKKQLARIDNVFGSIALKKPSWS